MIRSTVFDQSLWCRHLACIPKQAESPRHTKHNILTQDGGGFVGRATHAALCLLGIAMLSAPALRADEVRSAATIWIDTAAQNPDTYVAFRGRFDLAQDAEVELRTLGSGWFVAWLDGEYLTEGPARFDVPHPEYEHRRLRLPAGSHVLAVQAHHLGVETRMLKDMPPFLYCRLLADGTDVPIRWKCSRLAGYRPQVRRINPQLGWIEWCDTRQLPKVWQSRDFDDSAWPAPVGATTSISAPTPARIAPVRHFTHTLRPVAQGTLAETFGYELDDIPARFFLRDLVCDKLPPQGVWRRYDLGRVRLARPRFVLDIPAGAVVEFAYCEALVRDRVSPYITLSAGPSCNLDHYVARGGRQEFFPLTPKGGRFVEIHVIAPPADVRFIKEEFVERCYFDKPEGVFTSGDPLLDRIWLIGVETHRACAEDALIDNPTRERGQWTGDVVSVGMDINAVAYSDLRLCRRGLVQSAYCARDDGLVAGLCPGGAAYLATYAAQWINACVHYYELTGDRALLDELYSCAVRNLAAFDKYLTKDGLADGAGWVFVDWGYIRNPGPADIAYNLHYLSAQRAMIRWCRLVDRPADLAKHEKIDKQIATVVRRWLAANLSKAEAGWPAVGYHSAVLSLRLGLIAPERQADCIRFIKQHILDCFPNNADAPRLSAPDANNRRLITPYFAHYAFPALIERGEMDFVLDQYRKCWGWAAEGRTTWLEVFDTRWSHCHQWAGCPTWQLSRYALGLHPRFDLGANHYVLNLISGSLPRAKGAIPLPADAGLIRVGWERKPDGIHYSLTTDKPIWLHRDTAERDAQPVTDRFETVWP